eukprot:SAG11_NODE_7402_length_1149_cov_1.076190_1_plen_152_part_00
MSHRRRSREGQATGSTLHIKAAELAPRRVSLFARQAGGWGWLSSSHFVDDPFNFVEERHWVQLLRLLARLCPYRTARTRDSGTMCNHICGLRGGQKGSGMAGVGVWRCLGCELKSFRTLLLLLLRDFIQQQACEVDVSDQPFRSQHGLRAP